MSNNSVMTEVDDLITQITQSIDHLEDCIEWPEYEPDSPNEDQRREKMDGSVYDPESRKVSISGLSSSAIFNCFPSNRPEHLSEETQMPHELSGDGGYRTHDPAFIKNPL